MMLKQVFCFLFFFSSLMMFSQSSFRKLSSPEKKWVFSHPFVAKKAFHITKKVLADVDSIKKTGVVGADNNGGNLDAFKHAYWMASLTQVVGSKRALKLGKAHEKGNYIQYKKHLVEDSILPDSVSSEMDLRNNEAGANSIGRCHFKITRNEIQELILDKLKNGELFIIKKDAEGNYLDCNGNIIDLKLWTRKWSIPKCLTASS